MNGVFLDTVGLLGLWDEDDQWHPPASTAFEEMSLHREPLFTTSFVIAEMRECHGPVDRTETNRHSCELSPRQRWVHFPNRP